MNNKRWYDQEPTISLAVSLIKNSKPELDKEMLDQFDEDKKRLIES